MKFSYNWIHELVEGLDTPPLELMGLISVKTAECEGVESVGRHFSSVVAARVLTVEQLPGHNRKAVIDAGSLGRRTVVCGAPNCRPGIVTAYVPSGVTLAGRRIDKRVIEGVESDGMLASGAELEVNEDHQGIVELTGGLDLSPDNIIEVDNKSLTHRPDLWGHHGMAREVAAITGKRLRDPANLQRLPRGAASIQVEIEDFHLCPRYSALVFENATVRPSPLWLQYRLRAIGLNPINNLVDVTNFVMAELGQPMHAFDAEKLAGNTIHIRNAHDGERITALNDESYGLTAAALVIADANGPIALAGIIGGRDSAIGESTTRIVLESANFHAASIRRTSTRLKLRTDASMRFEKSQDAVNTVRGLARAIELLEIVSPGIRLAGGLAEQAAAQKRSEPIQLPLEWLVRKLGRPMEAGEVRRILEALMFGVTETKPGVFSVAVPSWRATKDISIKDDLVEEVGRMVGYATIPPTAPIIPAAPPPDNPRRRFHRAVRQLVAAQGYDEVYNYSFLSEDEVRRFDLDPAAHVRVANPISVDQALLRRTLVPGVWKNIQENSKHAEQFRLFEIGSEIHRKPGSLPDEIPHLTAAIYQRTKETGPLYEVKRLAECLMRGCELKPAAARRFEHPSRTADVIWKGNTVGKLFEFHPDFVEGRAVVLDVDLALIEHLSPVEKRYKPVRRFPESAFDLSVIAPTRALVGELSKQAVSFAGPYLESIQFLRQYEGAPLPEHAKSVSFRLTVAAQDRTLASEEVGAIRDAIIAGMRGLGYEMRV
ncbi:MAG TPA: phenylalanine--tRNA ligase subunit beta [Bryobacteraceae bacterium]|nr:phenylalanine--tRNA ligase subunit beta [Bryobacteraceae bacterium]